MSSSSVQNGGPSDAQPTAADRRDSRARRVEFGAFVEVGAGEAGGFEAESLDVSTEGMRLRTAYLPSPGQTLVCRFDGVGGDVVAEGEVAWCKQQARGGELGVRFSRLDANGAALLRDLCAGQAEAAAEALPEPPSADPNEAQPGARVRLHIQGLGSPMRARVRDVAGGEVLIGSNLEFLRVGRDVQLEDVERGARRVALIEHVAVEIDPESNVPQLVVALRYEDAEREPDATDPTTRPYRVSAGAAAAPAAPIGSKETTPEPAVIATRAARSARSRASMTLRCER
ncbi:MAG: PilZ domain-containing protein [Deltaproteobacteria bacterium]|nr:PilZ domain-containing protein [Deltaproteobacteria bacterium]